MPLKRENVLINIGLAIVLLSFPICGFILRPLHISLLSKLFYSRVFCWLLLIFLYAYARMIEKKSFLIWKQQSYDKEFYVISILTLFVLAYITNVFSAGISKVVIDDKIFYQNKLVLSLTIITAGFTEELIVRGYLIPRLSILFKNNYLPIIISALVFSSLHLGYHSLFYLIDTFLIGVIFGVFYQNYKNIHILILFHLFWDAIALYSHR